MNTSLVVGIAGFGKMGSAMAARLVETGTRVLVWNRDPEKPWNAGLEVAQTPRELASRADVIISSLFNDETLAYVYEEENGLIAAAAGKLFIEMSTVRPGTQQRLAISVRNASGAFIECPVSGTTGPARAGQLVGLTGGDAADIERARPVLDKLCRRLEHIGPIGAAATAKLAINLPLLAFWQAFGESMALMRHLGNDPRWLVELFGDTAGTPAVMKVKASALIETLAGRDSVIPTYDINAMRKDLRLMLAEAQARDFPLPLAATISSAFDEAAAAGWGLRDCSWIPAFWASKADSSGQ